MIIIHGSYRLYQPIKSKELIMAKKKKNNSSKIELSEGQTIAVAVIVIALGLVALIFGVQYLIDYFFPNF